MTADALFFDVAGAVAPFVAFLAVVLLGLSLLHMIGKTN